MSLVPHQQRMVEERDQLAERIARLESFRDGLVFSTLCEAEQRRLLSQAVDMDAYVAILNERIDAFGH